MAGVARWPRISKCFGIAIYMYWFDLQKHKASHFHARFGFDLAGNCLEGNLGPRATRLVVEWCYERQADLRTAWAAAAAGKEIPWVAPLR